MAVSLSPSQRLALIQHINRLVQPDFEQLVFVSGAPNSVIPSNSAAQGDRAIALINWVKSPLGCEMNEFLHVLSSLAPLPAELKSLLKNIQIELLNGVKLDLIHIPAGVFFMGSSANEKGREVWERPQHKVNVSAFYMGKYPVTQAQWYAVSLMDDIDMALSPDPSKFKEDDRPVEWVSWYEAKEFCKRLSSHIKRQGYTGQVCRLPSEAE